MRRLASTTALVALLGVASPAFAQDRTETPPPGGTGRTDAPGGAAPAAGNEGDRLQKLEQRIEEQEREIQELKRENEAKDLKKKPGIDEKGAVQEASAKKPSDPQFEWGYDSGFFVKGTIHDMPFDLRPVGRIQLDYRAFPHSSANDVYQNKPPQDEFLLRRARVGFLGTFSVFGFDLEVDPTRNSSTQLLLGDCWFQYQQFPEFVIRFGHFKSPFGLEDGMTSDNYTWFVERPMIVGSGTSLAPDFHPGVMVYGTFGAEKFGKGFFQYYLAAQNQTQNNVVGSGDPMTTARLASAIGELFLVGVSARWENRSGLPPVSNVGTAATTPPAAVTATNASATNLSFAGLTPGQYQFFAPVFVRGWTQAYNIDASYYDGPFRVKAEFGYASQERWHVLADHSSATGLVTQGGVLTAGWLFWGPPKGIDHPSFPFKDWQLFSMESEITRTRNVGCEILATLEWMSIGQTHGGRFGQNGRPAAPSTAPNADKVRGNDCKTIGLGMNLFAMENVKFSADWYHLRIGDEARAEKAHTRFADEFLFRAQLEF
jgi:phosphate-selective porin